MRILLALVLSLWIGGSAAAQSDADRTAVQSTIEQQLQAFLADDGATAYSFAAPNIRSRFPTEDIFMEMVRQGYRPVYRPHSYTFGELKAAGGGLEQLVDIVDAERRFLDGALHAGAGRRGVADHRLHPGKEARRGRLRRGKQRAGAGEKKVGAGAKRCRCGPRRLRLTACNDRVGLPDPFLPRHRPHRRFRQPGDAAHRAARARGRRLLRSGAVPEGRGGAEGAEAEGDHPVRRAGERA